MARTSYILMRWWCLLCTRSTHWRRISQLLMLFKSYIPHVR